MVVPIAKHEIPQPVRSSWGGLQPRRHTAGRYQVDHTTDCATRIANRPAKAPGVMILASNFGVTRAKVAIWKNKRILFPLMDRKLAEFGIKVMNGDCVVDLGANLGVISQYFLKKGATVHAYEPNPACVRILQRLAAFPKFRLFNSAVGPVSGKAHLYTAAGYNSAPLKYIEGVTLVSDKAGYVRSETIVECVTVDDVVKVAGHIKLMKVDIEGGEYAIYNDILRNMDQIDYIVMESHEGIPGKKEVHDRMIEAIAQSGYAGRVKTDWI
jgi:FkbM family methyltransferase